MTETNECTEKIKPEESDKYHEFKDSTGIKIGKGIVILVCICLIAILGALTLKIYNKVAYKSVALTDKKYYKNVAEFSYPKKWIPLGKVFFNGKSIPNLLTFFVATVNPIDIVECQFFSTQMESDNGNTFFSTGNLAVANPEKYFENAILKMSPTAQNIKLIKKYKPTYRELKQTNHDKNIFMTVYTDTNPGTEKGSFFLKNTDFLPIHYLYEYVEDGKTINHLIEGRFVFFNHCFSKSLGENPPIQVAINFIKCENIFSYKAEKSIYNKNYGIYKNFKKNLKFNEEWQNLAIAERQRILQTIPTITTLSLKNGEKFNIEAFKATVYNIEFPDEATKTMSLYYYGKDLKSFFTKWF